eukprot:GHVU01009913.1.p1 GENE.GHVU01009913.1~~GHVU01009913.1.p1  ORF type:complete len:297 (-),score=67.68 GHVU01009913.1:531-1421(-)
MEGIGSNIGARRRKAWGKVMLDLQKVQCPFELEAVKDKWKHLRSDTKEKDAKQRKHASGTGGGDALEVEFSEAEQLIRDALRNTAGWKGEDNGVEAGIDQQQEHLAEAAEQRLERRADRETAQMLGADTKTDSDSDDDSSGGSDTAPTASGSGPVRGVTLEQLIREEEGHEEEERANAAATEDEAGQPVSRAPAGRSKTNTRSSCLKAATQESHYQTLQLETETLQMRKEVLGLHKEVLLKQKRCYSLQEELLSGVKDGFDCGGDGSLAAVGRGIAALVKAVSQTELSRSSAGPGE